MTLGAGEFYYAEYGDPGGTPLLLLHGMPRDSGSWAGVAPELASAGHRVLAPDLRGHGRSARTDSYSLEEMREDVRQLADVLGLDRFVLGGHSMGGTVATLFAERYPGRLTGLILVDSPPPDGSGTWEAGPRPAGELPYDWPVVPAILAQLRDPDPAWWTELPAITAPTLVIGGGSTSPVPQDLLAAAAAAIPGGRLATIEGAGHSVHETRPAEFLAAARRFLRDLDGGSGSGSGLAGPGE